MKRRDESPDLDHAQIIPAEVQEQLRREFPISPEAQRRRDAARELQQVQATREFTERTAREAALRERALAEHQVRTETDFATILMAWKTMKAHGNTEKLSRADLRRMDMHIALADEMVLDAMRHHADAASLFDTIDRHVGADPGEPPAQPLMNAKDGGPFDYLTELGRRDGRRYVERGANARTRKEHQRARLGVEVALQTTDIVDFLHILDMQIGTKLGKKLTRLEKAALGDQLRNLLAHGAWKHPAPETARSFAAWEAVVGDVSVDDINIDYEVRDFQSEPPLQPASRLPGANDIGRFIFDEDGARTGKKKE